MLKIMITIEADNINDAVETSLEFQNVEASSLIEKQIASDIQDSITALLIDNSSKYTIEDKLNKIDKEEDYYKFDVVIEED